MKGIYYEMIRSLVETGYTYSSTEDFDISPVDYVAESCLFVALNIHRTNRQTYHLTSPNPATYNDIVNMLIGYGYTIRKIDDDEYFEALYEERMLRNGKPYRSTFTDLLSIIVGEDDVEEKGKFDTSKISSLLQGSDIICRESDASLMQTYLDYCVRRELIASPAKQEPLAEISKEMENKIFMQHLYDEDLELSDATT